jgi:hypothetical protein
LFGAAEAGRELIGQALLPVDRTTRSRDIEAARSRSTEAVFRTAWVEGRATTLERAVADALSDDTA